MMNKYFLIITLFIGYFSFAQKMEIPIVFHIVSHSSKDITKIETINFESIVDSINIRINNVNHDSISSDFRKDIGIPNIFFRMADKNEFCESINPVTFHKIKYSKTGLNDFDLRILKKKGYYDKYKYLNVWFVNVVDEKDDNQNAGKFSSLLDGVIIDIDELGYIGMIQKDPFLLIHEIGHYLGLKHIWGKNVNPKFPFRDGCDYDDGILDTPPQKEAHFKNSFSRVQESCNGKGKTNHQNFMDYSYDTGMFTKGQVAVMRNNLKTKRAGLLWKPNCDSSSQSVLSNTKQRSKLGTPFNFNHRLDFNTNIDLKLKGLFENELGISFTTDNLEKLGLKIIGTDKFKDLFTGKLVSQDYIYKYLDILNAKKIINKSSSIEKHIKPKLVQYYDVKKRQYYNESELFKKLSKNQISTFKKVRGNVILTKYSPNMTFEIYRNNKKVTPINLHQDNNIASFNLYSGTYRIICKVQSSYLGNGYKEVSYTKELADMTFEHLLSNNKQTILLVRGNNKNDIFYKKNN